MKLANAIAELIRQQCSEGLDMWLRGNYLWPDKPKKRLMLYGNFQEKNWATDDIQFITDDAMSILKQKYINKKKLGSLLNDFDKDCFMQNKLIRKQCSEALAESTSEEETTDIYTFFVKEWGGVNPKPDKIKEHVNKIKKIERNEKILFSHFKFEGVSSWSKMLSIAFPEDAHIYDARVVYSLNSLIYLNNLCDEMLWPSPDGRNSWNNFINIETLIIATQAKARGIEVSLDAYQGLAGVKKTFYYGPDFYQKYLNLLKDVSSVLSTGGRHEKRGDVEAFLFMIADNLIVNANIDKATGRELPKF
jgi:hypothetical protein